MTPAAALTLYLLKWLTALLIGSGVLALFVPILADYLWWINLMKRRTR